MEEHRRRGVSNTYVSSECERHRTNTNKPEWALREMRIHVGLYLAPRVVEFLERSFRLDRDVDFELKTAPSPTSLSSRARYNILCYHLISYFSIFDMLTRDSASEGSCGNPSVTSETTDEPLPYVSGLL